MNGWISLHRKVFNNPVVAPKKPYSKFEAWCWLMAKANHSNNKFVMGSEVIKTDEGEVVTSQKKLQQRFGWGNTRVRTYLKLLQSDEMIDVKSNAKRTHITICNYASYQDSQTKNKSKPNRYQTATKLLPNTINKGNKVNKVNNVNKKTINTLMMDFNKEIFTDKNEEKYGHQMLDEFWLFYSEPTQNGKQMKFQTFKTWSTAGRLTTWSKKDFNGYFKLHNDEIFLKNQNKPEVVYSDEEIATEKERDDILGNTKFKLRSM